MIMVVVQIMYVTKTMVMVVMVMTCVVFGCDATTLDQIKHGSRVNHP